MPSNRLTILLRLLPFFWLFPDIQGFSCKVPIRSNILPSHRHRIRLASCSPDESDDKNPASLLSSSRRRFVQMVTRAAATAGLSSVAVPKAATAVSSPPVLVPTPPYDSNLSWPLGKVAFSLLPLEATSTRRATVEECVVPDTIWTHDQLQGIVTVNVPVRQTVIRLSERAGGGLWVHNPVAPTPQLMAMMKRLQDQYGPVRHIVLGTVALEHKATFGAFCRQFPIATVWIQPGQWAFPLDLPIDTLGVTQRGPRLQELSTQQQQQQPVTESFLRYWKKSPEWTCDIDYEILGPFPFQSVGGFSETAFFHKSTRTLLVTDTVVSVTKDPPPIIQEDPRALLFHSRDNIDEVVTEDTPAIRQKGWRRMVQFGLVFFPSQIEVTTVRQALRDARNIDPSMRNLGQGSLPLAGLYPWSWAPNNADLANFEAISQNGKLFCPPILTKLILDREPKATLEWVDRVAKRFQFERVISCHLNNNVKANPQEFREAFDPLRSRPEALRPQRVLAEDLALLQTASDLLTKYGIVAPSLVCDGEAARVVGRFAN